MSGPFYPRTKRYTLSPVLFSSASQRGFSALSLFFMGLVLLVLMNFTGFFTHPKSPITDKNVYTATDAKKLDVKEGLHMVDLDFKPPAAPTISGTPTPTSAVCISDSGKKTDPSVCKCPYFTFLCVNGKAVEMNGHPNEFPYNDSLCKTYAKEGDGYYCIGKPVIYLYPEKPTYVDVTVSGNIVESIPLVEKGRLRTATSSQGWFGVLAMPGGVLKYKNQYFRELYYESETKTLNAPNNGMFIKTENLEEELIIQTQKLGLNSLESNEFVEYWTPRLKALNTKYIFFSILDQDEKDRTDHVEIVPTPDVFIQFIAYFKGVDAPVGVGPLQYPVVPERTGFTAVEWGGVVDRN